MVTQVVNRVAKLNLALIPVAGYARASTEKQDTSCARQRAQMEAAAERLGLRIVRWYEDDGQSGFKETRDDFLRLLKDAREVRDFEGVYVFEQDRFSRFDETEFKYYCYQLREAGVRFFRMREGELDLYDFTAMLTAGINQDQAFKFGQSLAYKVCSGHKDKALNGRWMARAPFGFTVTSTKRGGTGFLEVNETEAPWVRKVFEWFVRDGVALLEICRRLDKSCPRPARKGKPRPWRVKYVLGILANEAYLGHVNYGATLSGQFVRIVNGELVELPKTSRAKPHKAEAQQASDMIRVESAHPAIVTESLFRQAEQALSRRKRTKRRARSFPLTGVAVCGHCGNRLAGGTYYRPNGQVSEFYGCQSRRNLGLDTCPECRFSLNAGDLHDLVVSEVFDRFLRDDRIEQYRQAVVRFLRSRRTSQTAQAESVAKQYAEKDAAVKAAEARLLSLPEDMVAACVEAVRKLRADRDRLHVEAGLESRLQELTDKALATEASRVVTELRRLREDIESAEWGRMNAAIQKIVKSVTIFTTDKGKMKPGQKRKLARLEFEYFTDLSYQVAPSLLLRDHSITVDETSLRVAKHE